MKAFASRFWPWLAAAALLTASLVFNDSFRNTLARKRAIAGAQQEIDQAARDAEMARQKISRLEGGAAGYELLVRRELGYLKPGEKEIRFIHKQN